MARKCCNVGEAEDHRAWCMAMYTAAVKAELAPLKPSLTALEESLTLGENLHTLELEQARCSWLGSFAEVGWSIRIEPRLSNAQWERLSAPLDTVWSTSARSYDPVKCLELLGELFPAHALAMHWPQCTYRTATEREGKLPLINVCNAEARHTAVGIRDTKGKRVGIPRCQEHRGQL